MKKRRKAELQRMRAYVATLQPLMMLAHWCIEIPNQYPDNSEAWATIHRLAHAQNAAILLSRQHFRNTPEQQRETIVHELLHCHLRSLIDTPSIIKQEISLPLYAVLQDRMSHEEECLTDALAQVIAPFMPLPPKGA